MCTHTPRCCTHTPDLYTHVHPTPCFLSQHTRNTTHRPENTRLRVIFTVTHPLFSKVYPILRFFSKNFVKFHKITRKHVFLSSLPRFLPKSSRTLQHFQCCSSYATFKSHVEINLYSREPPRPRCTSYPPPGLHAPSRCSAVANIPTPQGSMLWVGSGGTPNADQEWRIY